jgi:hypothetical protein
LFEKGMSFGCHAETLLVYDIPADGEATVEFLNDGELLFSEEIHAENPTREVSINNPGGLFEIRCASPKSARQLTVLAICDVILQKQW